MQLLNIEQGSPEWFEARQLKMTASHATAVGNCGKGLETYILELCAEYFSNAEKEHYSNKHTERGNELEAQARLAYEMETGNRVKEVGFVVHNDYVGCSPDGFVGDDGLVEIKSPDDKEHFNFITNRFIKSDYIWQMQNQMLICKRKWCDFVSYNPNFDKNIIIERVYPDEEKQAKLLKGFEIGEKMIKELVNKYKEQTNEKGNG